MAKPEIIVASHGMVLHRSGALLLDEGTTAVVADLHIGKATHFGTSGIAISRKVEEENYWKLSGLLSGGKIRHLIFLGDMFHSRHNAEWERFIDFISQYHQLKCSLIVGNHDILDQKKYREAEFECMDEWLSPGLRLTHHPEDCAQGVLNVCGHLHPAFRFSSAIIPGVKLPCFHLSATRLILPAFGSFTGTWSVAPAKGDKIVVIAESGLIEIF